MAQGTTWLFLRVVHLGVLIPGNDPAMTLRWPQTALSIRNLLPQRVPSRTPSGQGSLIWVPSWQFLVLTLMRCGGIL